MCVNFGDNWPAVSEYTEPVISVIIGLVYSKVGGPVRSVLDILGTSDIEDK